MIMKYNTVKLILKKLLGPRSLFDDCMIVWLMASGQLITGGTVSTEENDKEGSVIKNIKQLLKLLKILHQLKKSKIDYTCDQAL